ncbi:tRNA pseudouridine(38-40) synthase TruA [Phaeodactylibacter xiamenensis]|jgi:tRNA pseudouridine38-40 synthase|uniref:tRNA pseudouridine(38-40) synthase TruA n=1 Tax=Phaeodactylibacter xiamenensis TaxID=1524460 RepID=UPI003CCBC9A1
MRYFAELAYNGTNYVGWQSQPGQRSVQGTIEEALSTILNTPIEVVGCGRTDAGVHAKQYFLHFDFDGSFPQGFDRRINKFLPPDIAIYRFIEVAPDAHARFDATHRAYEYHIDFRKNPFGKDTRYFFPFAGQLDEKLLQKAAQLLLEYQEFYPFCKSNTDVKTMRCDLRRAEWIIDREAHSMVFHIAADRFLRGMVRLIVGMCLNVAHGKLDLKAVRVALEQQTRLPKSLSAPPDGLYLTDIRYPFIDSAT